MRSNRLLALYDRVADAPDALGRLRRFVLDLAVRGTLVEQDPADEPASKLLTRMAAEKARMVKAGEIRKPRSFANGMALEAAFEIPATWCWCRLDAIGAIVGGGTPPASDSRNFAAPGDGVAWLTPKDLGGCRSRYVGHGSRDLSPRGLDSSSATLMPVGTVVFSSRAPIGYVAIAANPVATNQGFKSVVPYESGCSRYIALALRSLASEIEAGASGTTFKEVSGRSMAGTPFPLPPLAEQHRIVAKVDQLMALCDRLEKARAAREDARSRLTRASLTRLTAPETVSTTSRAFRSQVRFAVDSLPALTARADQFKHLRETILSLAVRGKLVEQDPADEPVFRSDGRTQPELPFRVPRNWRWSRLCALGDLKGGGTPSKARADFWGGCIPWVSPKDMKRDYIAGAQTRITEAAVGGSAANVIEPDSVLFVVRGMILAHSFPVAVSRVPLTINQDMKAITLKSPETAEYLLRALKALKPEMLARVQRSTHGTCRIAGADYRDFMVPLPPLAEQQRIVAKVDQLMALCDRLEAGLGVAETSRGRLLEALLHESLVSQQNVRSRDAPGVARAGT